jgi:hypothetical protein
MENKQMAQILQELSRSLAKGTFPIPHGPFKRSDYCAALDQALQSLNDRLSNE